MRSIAALAILISIMWASGASAAEAKSTWGSIVDALYVELSDRDTILLVDEIAWGPPTRWSFSTTYVHKLNVDLTSEWARCLTISLSPGTDGGRLSLGIQSLGFGHSAVRAEARVVAIRTWNNPLEVEPNQTFVGVEGHVSIAFGLVAGYYWRVDNSVGGQDSLFAIRYRIGF